MTKLDQRARSTYFAEGYYIGRNILNLAYIQKYLSESNKLLVAQLKHSKLNYDSEHDIESIYRNLVTLYKHDQKTYIGLLRVISKLKSLYEIYLCESVENCCSTLGVNLPFFHTLPVLHIMSNQLKIEGGYQGFGAHQDWTALQTSINIITTWIPFTPVDSDSFPLQVVPRSHTQGIYTGTITDNIVEVSKDFYSESDFISVQAEPTDIIFMSNFTIHRSGLSTGNKIRIAASWRYEDAADPTFCDRKYPMAQRPHVERELFFINFPSTNMLERYYSK